LANFCALQQEEEIQNLQKQIQQLEGDLDTAQTQLAEATTKLENTEKELSKVNLAPTLLSTLSTLNYRLVCVITFLAIQDGVYSETLVMFLFI